MAGSTRVAWPGSTDALDRLLLRLAAARQQPEGGPDAAFAAGAAAALDATFACTQHLAVYGTLAPGGANHDQLAGIDGQWTAGEVHGRSARRRYPVFTFDPGAPPVPVQLFAAPALPAHWPRLDAFEEAHYRRILVPVMRGGRLLVVANLYAAVVPVGS